MHRNVVILCFSGRSGGNCEQISEFIKHFYMRTNVLVFKIDNISVSSCGGCNYECLKQCEICPKLTDEHRQLMDAIVDADIVYFIVPNYCGYPCANYFAFNERSVGYFNMDRTLMEKYMAVKKRFIIISNTETNFAEAMQQQTNEAPDILYLKSGKFKKQNIAGDLMTSDAAKADLWAFLDDYLSG